MSTFYILRLLLSAPLCACMYVCTCPSACVCVYVLIYTDWVGNWCYVPTWSPKSWSVFFFCMQEYIESNLKDQSQLDAEWEVMKNIVALYYLCIVE